MRVREIIARWRGADDETRAPRTTEAFTVMHSADLDVHLAGVARAPSTAPPWPTATWERHTHARARAPSVLARVLLETHPAFLEASTDDPHWMQVDQAETMALEWVAAGFTSLEAAQWLTVHPGIAPLRARELVTAGLGPRDPMLLPTPHVIVLPDRATEVRATG